MGSDESQLRGRTAIRGHLHGGDPDADVAAAAAVAGSTHIRSKCNATDYHAAGADDADTIGQGHAWLGIVTRNPEDERCDYHGRPSCPDTIRHRWWTNPTQHGNVRCI